MGLVTVPIESYSYRSTSLLFSGLRDQFSSEVTMTKVALHQSLTTASLFDSLACVLM